LEVLQQQALVSTKLAKPALPPICSKSGQPMAMGRQMDSRRLTIIARLKKVCCEGKQIQNISAILFENKLSVFHLVWNKRAAQTIL
jgi:hypothetical protein